MDVFAILEAMTERWGEARMECTKFGTHTCWRFWNRSIDDGPWSEVPETVLEIGEGWVTRDNQI